MMIHDSFGGFNASDMAEAGQAMRAAAQVSTVAAAVGAIGVAAPTEDPCPCRPFVEDGVDVVDCGGPTKTAVSR